MSLFKNFNAIFRLLVEYENSVFCKHGTSAVLPWLFHWR